MSWSAVRVRSECSCQGRSDLLKHVQKGAEEELLGKCTNVHHKI